MKRKLYFILLIMLIASLCLSSCSDNIISDSCVLYPTFEWYLNATDGIVFAKFEKTVWHIETIEYVFDVTELVYGDVTTSKLSVYSPKENIFSEDEYSKQFPLKKYEKGSEYLLFLNNGHYRLKDDQLAFVDHTFVELGNEKSRLGYSNSFYKKSGLPIDATREEVIQYLIDFKTPKATNEE